MIKVEMILTAIARWSYITTLALQIKMKQKHFTRFRSIQKMLHFLLFIQYFPLLYSRRISLVASIALNIWYLFSPFSANNFITLFIEQFYNFTYFILVRNSISIFTTRSSSYIIAHQNFSCRQVYI